MARLAIHRPAGINHPLPLFTILYSPQPPNTFTLGMYSGGLLILYPTRIRRRPRRAEECVWASGL